MDWLIPLCHFASHWHNGHGRPSKKDGERVSYRLLCLAMRAARRRGCLHPLDVKMTPEQREVYRHLEETYIPFVWRRTAN